MALRWIEGFEVNIDSVALPRVYTGSQTSVASDLTAENPAQKRGASGQAVYDFAASSQTAYLHTPDLVVSPVNSWIFGFAFRSDSTVSLVNVDAPHIAAWNTDGEQIRLEVYEYTPASSKPGGLYYGWRIVRGATEIARSDQVFELLPTDDEHWIYFEFKVTIDNASGSVDGRYKYVRKQSRNASGAFTTLTWDNAVTSIDTQNQSSTGADSFVISFDTGAGGQSCAYDDLYICDSTGSKNNDYLGRCFVTPLHITLTGGGDGDTVEWALASATSTEDALQEPPGSVEDDLRLTSDTTGQIHLAAMGASNSLDFMDQASIIGVRMDVHGRMETSGTLGIGFMWRKTTATAAQTEFGTALSVSSTTIEAASVIAEDDPNTATDWVFADLSVAQFGVKNNG